MKAASFFVGIAMLGAVAGLIHAESLGANDRICTKGYARSQRVDRETAAYLKQEVFRRDVGANGPYSIKDFELDQVVPLCLGGTNALANLQLQHWSEARLKDGLESEVCRAYCAGKVKGGLNAAREFFRSGDWRDQYLLQELLLP